MNSWFILFLGILIGWGIELLIDYLFWRKRLAQAYADCDSLRARIESLEIENQHLQDDLKAAQAYTADYDGLRAQIDTLEIEKQRLQENLESLQAHVDDCDSLRVRIESLERENQRLQDIMKAQVQEVDTRATSIPLSEEPVNPDDLRKIEGIGAKIAQVLNAAGIYTFAQLADTEVAELRIILKEAGPRFQLADPSTWPEQAALAARGAWEELNKLQDTLKGGRK